MNKRAGKAESRVGPRRDADYIEEHRKKDGRTG
jgi:hypothetical protein